ncbi:MAG TPA: dihydrofolate reductase family protein [Chryseosolibacter sp.]
MMRRIIVAAFVTLDGVMQGAGGPEDGFETFGGWSAPYLDDSLNAIVKKQMQPAADLLLGRKTFEVFATVFPEHDEYWPGINEAKKYVVSTTLEKSEWKNSVFLGNADAIKVLKNSDGPDLKVHGSGSLVQTLLKLDLIDELRLHILPITLGAGRRLFDNGTIPAAFTLVESTATPSGAIATVFRRAGAVSTGTM